MLLSDKSVKDMYQMRRNVELECLDTQDGVENEWENLKHAKKKAADEVIERRKTPVKHRNQNRDIRNRERHKRNKYI